MTHKSREISKYVNMRGMCYSYPIPAEAAVKLQYDTIIIMSSLNAWKFYEIWQ